MRRNKLSKREKMEIKECIQYHHDIVDAKICAPLTLLVKFDDGKVTEYNVIEDTRRAMPHVAKVYEKLRDDPALFSNFIRKISCIRWTDEIDLGCETLYHDGKEVNPETF